MKNLLKVSYAKSIGVGMVMFSNSLLSAQSVLIGNQPMQFNPAFAGSTGNARMGIDADIFKSKYPSGLQLSHHNISASFDHFIPKLMTGVGLQTSYNNNFTEGSNYNSSFFSNAYKLENLNLGLSIAPKFSFRGKYTFSPAVEIGVRYLKTNTVSGPNATENEQVFLKPALRIGMTFNVKKFYVGLSYDLDDNLPNLRGTRFGYLQMGYNFQKREDSKFSFTPQVVYNFKIENGFAISYLVTNLNFRYNQFVWGTCFGYGKQGLMVGWQKNNFRIAYIQALSLSNFNLLNSQISFRYNFNTKKPVQNNNIRF